MSLVETVERLNALKLEHRTPDQKAWVDRHTDDQDRHTIAALLIGTGVTVEEVDGYVSRVIATVNRDRQRGGFLRAAKAADERWVTVTGPLAVCRECDWAMPGDHEDRALWTAARKHARDTGHGIAVERGQVRYLNPPA